MVKVIKKQISQEDVKGKLTKKVMSKLSHQSEEELASAFANSINALYIDTNLVPISNESIKLLSEADSRQYNLVSIQKVAKKVTLASSDPTAPQTQEFIKKLTQENGWQIKVFVISKTNLEKIWDRYKKIVFVDILTDLSINISKEDLEKFDSDLKNLMTLNKRIDELSTTEILNIIMGGSYKLGASDVHMEPEDKDLRLRYRIDGVLHDVAFLPIKIFKSVVSRIKMMSGMKINLRDIAKDGTFTINLADKKIKIRVSIIPGRFGESIVMRLLDPDSISVNVEKLGLRGLAYEEIQKQITAPNGMILTTGPTGSGKTTTLYAIINKLNDPETKIITIKIRLNMK